MSIRIHLLRRRQERDKKAPGYEPDGNSDESRFRGKLKKLLLYRLMLAVSFLVLALAVQFSRHADLLSSIFHPLYAFTCILFVFTIVGALRVDRVRKLVMFAWGQLIFDGGDRKFLFIPVHARDH